MFVVGAAVSGAGPVAAYAPAAAAAAGSKSIRSSYCLPCIYTELLLMERRAEVIYSASVEARVGHHRLAPPSL